MNFKGKEHLENCFTSIFTQTYRNYEAFLMDQEGGDGSDALVRENFGQVKILHNSNNLGTAGGFNYASRNINHDYLLFLANDTKLEPNTLEELMKLMDNPSVGIVSVKMLDYYHTDIIDQIGFKVDFMGFPAAIGRNEYDSGQYEQPFEAFPTGTGLLIRNRIFQKLDGFDNDFFTLQDEIDLAWRVEMLGYKCMVNPRAILYHKVSATLKKRRRWYLRFLSEKNTLRMLLKNYKWFNLSWILPIHFLVSFVEFICHFVTFRFKVAFALPLATLWNIYKLPTTLNYRCHIQKIRTIGDWQILKKRKFRIYKFKIFWDVIMGKISYRQ